MNLAAGLLLVALLSPATSVDQAKELYEAGSRAYAQGQYAVAIRAFEEARRLADQPAILFSLAQAYRLQYFVDRDHGHLERAVELYRAYVDRVTEGGRRDHAVQHLSTLEPMLQRERGPLGESGAPAEAAPRAQLIVASATAGATARVDGGDPQAIPATFEVQPGRHLVLVEAPTFLPRTVEATSPAGSVVGLNVDLDPQPGRLMVHAPEGSAIAVDGRLRGRGPLTDPLDVPAGRHLVAVTERGRDPFLQTLEIGRGEAVQVTAALDLSAQRVAAWSLFGASALLAVGAGVSGWQAYEYQSDALSLEDRLDARGFTVAEAERHQTLEEDRDEAGTLALGLGAAAVGVAVTGAVLWFFDTPDPAGAPLLAPPPAAPATAGLRAPLGVR